MISGSNEQLQQQLEYTLQKSDCHSWWISKMQCAREEERYVIKFYFKLGENATETYGMLQAAFGASCMNRVPVFEWHKRFKEGRESVGMMRGVGGVRKSIDQSWLAKRLGLGLLCWGSSGKDSVGRGQHTSNRVSGISTRTYASVHKSLSQTIWPIWASRLFLTFPIVPQLCSLWLLVIPKAQTLSFWDNWGEERGYDDSHWHAHYKRTFMESSRTCSERYKCIAAGVDDFEGD